MSSIRLAVHVHSNWSYDGSWTLRAIATAFRRRRYDAVLLCEHDRSMSSERLHAYRERCLEESKGILLVPGIEYSDPDNVVHLPTWGPVPFLGANLDTTEVLQRVRAHGGLSVLAHPARNDALARLDPDWIPLLTGVEVWSRKYDGWQPNLRAVQLAADSGLHPFTSLDFHRRRQFAPLAVLVQLDAWVGERGPALEPALLSALAGGRGTPHAAGRSLDTWAASRLSAHVLTTLDGSRRAAARIVRSIIP